MDNGKISPAMPLRTRILILMLIVAESIAVVSFASCKKKPAPTESVTDRPGLIIGFSQIGAESAWRTCNTESMQKAAAEAGIQMVYANAEQKQENQIKAIRSFIVYQVDVIVFVPIVQDGWDNVLQEAKDAGIPVIVLDRKLIAKDENLWAGYIGGDSLEEGRSAARFLLKKYKGQPGPFNILEIRGTDGASVTEGRHQGFCEILKNDERFSIVHSESGDYLRSRGQEIARKIVSQNMWRNIAQNRKLEIDGKQIDIIFSHNDGMALGALSVLENSVIRAGTDITIISVDAQQEAIDALRAGKINCVVECNPKQGRECISLVKDVAAGKQIPRQVYVSEQVFSEYDDLSNIEPRGY